MGPAATAVHIRGGGCDYMSPLRVRVIDVAGS